MKHKDRNTLTTIIKAGEGKDFSNIRIPGVPIYQSSNYLYENVETGTSIQLGEQSGHIYTRYTNPTTDTLNEIMADIEGTDGALSFASGMAAISSTIFAWCQPGDHIVSSAYIYGGTYTFFQKQLQRFKIDVTFVDPRNHEQIRQAIQKNTKILYTEPLANPTLIASDINFWNDLARENKCKLLIDNTFTPPPVFHPARLGSSIILHSATKYLGGHSDLLGGIVCAGSDDIEHIKPIMKTFGPTIAPLISWLLIRGIRTLGVRIERQSENALTLARFLENHPKINRVFYAGLESNPQYDLCRSQFNGYTGMLSFEVKGGWPAAKKLMEKVKTIMFTVSLGDVSSLICHPASTSHVYLTEEERQEISVTEGLLRLSIGIEYIDDLQNDLEQALDKID
jgi:methionine-gamma-lyase